MRAELVGGPLGGRTCDLEVMTPTIRAPLCEILRYEIVDGVRVPIFAEARYRLIPGGARRLRYVHLPDVAS